MAEIKVFYDQTGRTLTVWFGDPSLEAYSQDVGDDTVVMKSSDGSVLGFEKLNISFPESQRVSLQYENQVAGIAA